METIRTPDDRFADLPDWPWAPHYAEIDDLDGATLRVHYIDEGRPDADPVLLLHGEPTWGYLFRHMVGPLVAAGLRVVVPDLVGFGRSDKPTATGDYTYARHVAWMRQLIVDRLDLRRITFFGQDWGGLVGLRVLAGDPDRYARVVIGNTGLPTGDNRPSPAFLAWQRYSQTVEDFRVGGIVKGGCQRELSPAEIAAYDAPFPDDRYKAGARIFPALVPTAPDDPASADNRAAWAVLERFDRPFVCAFSDKDPVTAGGDKPFRQRIPGAQGRVHPAVEGGGHFLQEDRPEALVALITALIEETN
jgi:haloalkane dehalogenase